MLTKPSIATPISLIAFHIPNISTMTMRLGPTTDDWWLTTCGLCEPRSCTMYTI